MFPAPPGATRNRAGFTLLELLAVVAIIALLAALGLAGGRYALEHGKITRARAELTTLAAALENYRRTYGDYPRTEDEDRLLQALLGRRGPANQPVTAPALIDAARFATQDGADPFANPAAVLADPWGRPYVYAYRTQTPWTNPSPVLYSCGPDGADWSILLSGGYPDHAQATNEDNVYATP